MNSTLYYSNFHCGIHHYGCVFNKFYMILIHKQKIVRKFSPIYGSYFIIKINALNSNTFKQFYDLLNDGLHSFVKINYKECKGYSNSNGHKSNYNKI
ncbi:hypothetical protein H8356DRAFT_1330106 [Neocallimastix lanati (nom. inval.)]|nr:hypothetical protein H8356DRAFT_1330106 [Neocallimastix sp. JGI-2020a]